MAERTRKGKRVVFTPRRTPEWKSKKACIDSNSSGTPKEGTPQQERFNTTFGSAFGGHNRPEAFAPLDTRASSAKRVRQQMGLVSDFRLHDDGERRVEPDRKILKDITSKTWRMYRVSCLYNFRFSRQSLKLYSRSLTAHIKEYIVKCPCIVGDEENVLAGGKDALRAMVTVLSGLKAFEDDNPAVQVTVFGADDMKGGILVEAILCGCGILGEGFSGGFSGLPLMLINGSRPLGNCIMDWIKNSFDCFVSNLELISSQMNFLVAKWAQLLEETSHKPVQLCYQRPGTSTENRLDFTVKLNQESIQRICSLSGILPDSESAVSLENAKRFSNVLGDCVFRTFKLNVKDLSLVTIVTPVAHVRAGGQVTIFMENKAAEVLENLAKMADYVGEVLPV